MINFKFYLIIFLISTCYGSGSERSIIQMNATDNGAQTLLESEYKIKNEIGFFQTKGFFDEAGAKHNLVVGQSFQYLTDNFNLYYGLTDQLELSMQSQFVMDKSTMDLIDMNNSGPVSFGGQVKYSFKMGPSLIYALSFFYKKSLISNTRYTTTPIGSDLVLGDDGDEVGGGGHFTYKDQNYRINSGVLFNSPGNGMSYELKYNAELLYSMSNFNHLEFYTGVDGIFSMNTDKYTDILASKPQINRGSTHLFNSTNREKIEPYLGFNLNLNRFILGAKAASLVSGKSIDFGETYSMNLSYQFGGITNETKLVNSFKDYQIEASVLKVSKDGKQIKIDQGSSSNVEKGGHFDIYQTDYLGGNELIASGVVKGLGIDWAIIQIEKVYKNIEIKTGFVARGN